MNTKRFVTLHPMPIIDPGFLNRDVGQIGQTLKKEIWYKPEVWWLPVPGKEIQFVLDDQSWVSVPSRFWLFLKLWREAKDIHVLHLYHIWHFTLLFALLYKIRNSDGKVYVKLDCPFLWKKDIAFIFTRWVLLVANWVWVEDRRFMTYLSEKYSYAKEKFIFTPSWAIQIDSYIWKIQKKKQISLAWRFGDPVKNYELFLDVLETQDIGFLDEYKIVFIGGYTEKFKDRVEKIRKMNPKLSKNIELTGFLQQKEVLYDILSESSIFLHTSNHEWDTNIQYDSMFCWCYMVSTDVWNISQNYPKKSSSFYGIWDTIALLDTLQRVITDSLVLSQHDPIELQQHCLEHFVWKKSLAPLISDLQIWKK